MESWDYTEWYNRQPLWLRVLLFPLLVPVLLVHSTVGMAFFLLVVLPFLVVRGWIENQRFWSQLRARGQVAQWPEIESRVFSGFGTLIVEVTPMGPGCSWFIDLPRDAIDPEHVVPSWQEFEQQGGDVFESPPAAIESLDRWTLERLGACTASARALVTSAKQLAELGVEAKHQSVLAVPWCCKGSLTRRVE